MEYYNNSLLLLLFGWWEKSSAPSTCSWLTDGGRRLLPSPQCENCVMCPPMCVSMFCIYSVWHLRKALGLWSSGTCFAFLFFFFLNDFYITSAQQMAISQSASQSVLPVPSLRRPLPPLSVFTTQQDWRLTRHVLRLHGREDHEHDSEHNAPLITEDESQSLECSLGTGRALYCQNVAVEVDLWHNFTSLY